MYRLFSYFLGNGLFAGALYVGVVREHAGFWFFAQAIGWIVSVLMLLSVLFAREDMVKNMKKNSLLVKYPLMRALDLVFDVVVCAVFVYAGANWLGVFYFLHLWFLQWCVQDAASD